jgi:hypothetical protein
LVYQRGVSTPRNNTATIKCRATVVTSAFVYF